MSVASFRGTITPQKQFVSMFALSIAIQAFHMVEHVAQVLQKFVFHNVPAHGLIGRLDLEQIHFAFNLFYLATLIVVMVGWLYYARDITDRHVKLFGFVIFGTVLLQSYHMLEHVVKLIQFLETGMQGTPGILGTFIDGVVFHAMMNTAVLVPMVVVFVCAGLTRVLWQQPYRGPGGPVTSGGSPA